MVGLKLVSPFTNKAPYDLEALRIKKLGFNIFDLVRHSLLSVNYTYSALNVTGETSP